MLKMSFTPKVADYVNPKHMRVNLEFPEVSGDETIETMIEMFKEFLNLMSYDKDIVDCIQLIVPSDDDDDGYDMSKLGDKDPNPDEDDALFQSPSAEDIAEISQYATVEDLRIAHGDIFKEYDEHMDEVEEIVQENEEHRS